MLKNIGNKNKLRINVRFGLFLAISLVLGIVFAYYIYINQYLSAFICVSSFLVFSAFCFLFGINKNKRIEKAIILLSFVLAFLLGACSLSLKIENYKNADLNNHWITVTGSVKAVERTENGATVVLNKVKTSMTDGKLKYSVKVYVTGDISLELGDKIKFSDYLFDKDVFFDSRISSYDISARIKWNAYVKSEQVELLESSPNIFQKINIFIKNTLNSGLDKEEFSIAYALLTGDSNLIDEEVLLDFRSAGVAHVFAVSGLHIGFIATAIGFLLEKFRTNKILKVLILIACLFIYSGVCGFSSSSLRAGIMCSIASILKLLGKRYDGLNAVGIAGFIILLFSPLQMLCAGFVLSFGVVIGMLIMQRPIERLLSFLPKRLASALALVISAQLASIPICIAFFNNFSLIAVVANLLFVPLVAVVFYILLLAVLIGGLFNIAVITLFIPGLILRALTFIITVLDYKIFIVSGLYLGGFAIFYYTALFISSGMINLSRISKCVLSLILITVCVFGSFFSSIKQLKSTKLYVTATNSFSATLITNEVNTLIVSYSSPTPSYFSLSRLINRLEIERIDNVIVSSGANIDLQNLATNLHNLVDLEKIYYFGETNQAIEKVIESSFLGVNAISYGDGEINGLGLRLNCLCQGNAFILEKENRKVLVFAKLKGVKPITSIEKSDFDLIVASDFCVDLENFYSPKTIYCYRNCDLHTNSITGGNLRFELG